MTQSAGQRKSGRPFTAQASDVVTFPEPVRAWVLALRKAICDRFGTLLAFHAAYERSMSDWEAGSSGTPTRYVLDKKEVSRQLRDGRRYPGGPSDALVRRIVELCCLSHDEEYLTLQKRVAKFAAQHSRKAVAGSPPDAGSPAWMHGTTGGNSQRLVDVTSLVGQIPPRSDFFVGRSAELAWLESAVIGARRAVVVAVHGLGGTGKSTLAARFAQLHGARFELVWWVTADSSAAIDNGLAELAVAVEPDVSGAPAEQRVEAGMRWLSTHQNWLLILDNVTAPADADGLLSRVRTGAVIVTSRRSTGWRGMSTVALNVLPQDDAEELLAQTVYADWPDADLDGAGRLCEELGSLPLAVHQAGSYIAQTRITPAVYLALLDAYPVRMFTATEEGGDSQRTMARVWHVTLDRLADTPTAGQILRQLAWYAPDNIPRVLVTRASQDPDLLEALGRLAAYSMIRLDAYTISVHRLVQAVTRIRPRRPPPPPRRHRQRP